MKKELSARVQSVTLQEVHEDEASWVRITLRWVSPPFIEGDFSFITPTEEAPKLGAAVTVTIAWEAPGT